MMKLPTAITLCEVGLRDGLQNEATILNTQSKITLTKEMIAAGLTVIELGSFMNPKAVPQMADTDALFFHFSEVKNVELRALVANKKGVERAVNCGCRKIKLNVSASLGHNLANINMTPEESIARFAESVELAEKSGIEVSGSISMPFGSPWEGSISLDAIQSIIDAYLKVGVREISLSDASGMAVPNQVYTMCKHLQERYSDVKWWLHFHNTRGMAMANILAGMQAGITHFDSSLGGLGGCPFVPGAAGNVASEDVIHMLDEMNISTGIDLVQIISSAKKLQDWVGHETDSYVLKAGRSKDLIK
ncbi:hydroxymethylglutaryl-CoA lyase [Anoxynatronum buryatiense]|uniref:Hydroxymethylglutaryl-CoA lyase n=2 Tax=Anoxynatronum buryatiense TaxID=489973 RepID=A0AA46AIB5_9CLOT|nr:hydroxymethylglutaryl-CoA lyase [Anoxynatronum buryatiense]